jgi:hypothetical protein
MRADSVVNSQIPQSGSGIQLPVAGGAYLAEGRSDLIVLTVQDERIDSRVGRC